MKYPALLVSLAMSSSAALPLPAVAQSVCTSDGQPQPVRLMERFTKADCADCWRDMATAKATPGTAVLDWILPSSLGNDAPLFVLASDEGVARLEAMDKSLPTAASVTTRAVALNTELKKSVLRVARGFALRGYVGVSIALKARPSATNTGRVTAWLALVETLPAGLEGSPLERNLVRNVFRSEWDLRDSRPPLWQKRLFEQRSMRVADGVDPDRLKVVGWIEDARGRLLIAAQSVCSPI